MSAATEIDRRGTGSEEQSREQGLQHQDGAAGGTDAETKTAALDMARLKFQATGTEFVAANRCPADCGGGVCGGQMLTGEAGFSAGCPNVVDGKRCAGHQRQGQSGANDLTAAFSHGAINDDHAVLPELFSLSLQRLKLA